MRKKITAILKNIYLEDFTRSCFRKLRWTRRLIFRVDQRLIKKYFLENETKKLQLGSGSNALTGWLNTNYYPKSDKVVHVDATKKFPFTDKTFDYIYNEHMFEHITINQGIDMLNECYRVLKPGGILRIVTPDFQFLLDLYNEEKTDSQKKYIKTNTEMFIKDAPYEADIIVINNFFKDWGHQFIYDEKALKKAFSDAGFTKVKRFSLTESYAGELQQLAHEERYPEGFLKLESMVVEGVKA